MLNDNLKYNAMIPVAMAVLLLAGSATATTLSFTPDNPLFIGPELQTVQVSVDDVTDLLAASFVVGFDPAVVIPVAVSSGELIDDGPCPYFFQWMNPDGFTDTIEVDAAMLGCTTAGGGALLNITFAGVETGTSALTLIDVDFRDGQNNQMDVTLEVGAVSYLAEIAANISFQPESVVFDQEGTGEICLAVDGVEDFLGMTVEFTFDPAVITPVSIAAGSALQDAGCPFFLDWVNSGDFLNSMQLDMALLGCTVPIDGPLVCVTLQGVGLGESPLTWLNVEVRDGNNENVLINTFDGMVVYDPAVGNTPVTLDALKSIYK